MPLAFTKEEYIDDVNINNDLNLGVMINASEINTEECINQYMNDLFPYTGKKSNLSFVRIASKFEELEATYLAVKWLKKKGYKVFINLMYISSLSKEELLYFAEKSNYSKPDVLYLGDSTGTLLPQNIEKIISTLRTNWCGDIGIHSHDNMHRALINTLEANKYGANWLDCTVNGMGRGPGNAKTEDLVFEIKNINDKSIDFLPLIDLVQKEFFILKQQYKWGSNPFYYLSGKNEIHPTYIQNMLDDKSYRNEDIYASIKELKSNKSTSFKVKKLQDTRIYFHNQTEGDWEPREIFCNKEILLIAPGKSTIIHKKAIEKFILKFNPEVIALNILDLIDDSLINYRIACHPIRIFSDFEKYKNFRQPLIMPEKQLIGTKKKYDKLKIFDFSVKVESNKFKFENKRCIIPKPLVMAYALAVLNSGKAKKIYCVGFDGYGAGDPRQKEANQIWEEYFKYDKFIDTVSLTKTIYDIPANSIYSYL